MPVGNKQQQNGDRCLALFGAHQHSSTASSVRWVQPPSPDTEKLGILRINRAKWIMCSR